MKTAATPFLWRNLWQGIGSLWLGAVLLCLMLIAMACATVFESMHGTERALASFYRAWWFLGLVSLLGVNVVVAMLLRYPFTRLQVGFIATHGGILIILVGAVVTQMFGVSGEVSLAEGESAAHLAVDTDVLSFAERSTGRRASTPLSRKPFRGFRGESQLDGPHVALGDVRVSVEAYAPDTVIAERVANDAPHAHRAVEVALVTRDREDSTWLFLDQKKALGPSEAVLRQLSEADLALVVKGEAGNDPVSAGTIRVDHSGKRYEITVESCLENPLRLGDTGLTLRLLRYLPRATVGEGNKLANAPSGPPNPAIEVEIEGPEGTAKRIAFARFPDFQSMHDSALSGDFKVTLIPSPSLAPKAPIEVLSGPGSDVYVRFGWEGVEPTVHKLSPGVAVEAPWPGSRFVYRRTFENARTHRVVEPVEPVRKRRVPALRVGVYTADDTFETWIRRNEPRVITIAGSPYQVEYTAAAVPLGLSVKLETFQVGYYPGGRRPRSFESRVTFVDPSSGRSQTRLISMNHPASFGGYTFYQSSYYGEPGKMVSVLSVSRDVGRPVVYAGYVLTLIGMTLVLVTRARERRAADVKNEWGAPPVSATARPEPAEVTAT